MNSGWLQCTHVCIRFVGRERKCVTIVAHNGEEGRECVASASVWIHTADTYALCQWRFLLRWGRWWSTRVSWISGYVTFPRRTWYCPWRYLVSGISPGTCDDRAKVANNKHKKWGFAVRMVFVELNPQLHKPNQSNYVDMIGRYVGR